jgi:hypothetical protein
MIPVSYPKRSPPMVAKHVRKITYNFDPSPSCGSEIDISPFFSFSLDIFISNKD